MLIYSTTINYKESFMNVSIEVPYYQEGDYQNNDAAFQISQLVRNCSDARRLLTPIRCCAHVSDREEDGEELASIIRRWDDTSFTELADRALDILEELDKLWTAGNGVEDIQLGERRVLLNALSTAIGYRVEQLQTA